MTRVYQLLNSQTQATERLTRESAEELYRNQEELKDGLAASEFNLRAHQKVLNALALEIERFRALSMAFLPESQVKEELREDILRMANVTLPSEDDEPQVVRRIDWPYYHEQVEKDLKLLEELEASREAEEAQAKEEAQEPPQDDSIPEGAVVFGGK